MGKRRIPSVDQLAARLDLQTLRIFLTAAESGSLSETAVRENLVVSAVSRRIAALEDVLGVRLLERRHHGVKPTGAGQEVAARIREIHGILGRLQDGLEDHGRGLRGEVRLHANTSALLDDTLPSRVAAFARDHPDVDLRLKEWDSAQVIRSIRDGDAHIGVHSSYADAQDLQTFRFTRTRLVLLAHPGHPLAARRSLRFEETLDHDYVVLQDGSSLSALLTHMLRFARRLPKPMRIRLHAGSVGAACRLAEAGAGITLVQASSARLFAGALNLVEIPLDDAWASVGHDVCVRDANELPPAASRLWSVLREAVRPADAP